MGLKKYLNIKLDNLCIRIGFIIGKIIPIKEKNIILATNRSEFLNGNLKILNDALCQDKKLKIITYLKNNNLNKIDLVKMYYNFATAKYIFIDDYYYRIYGMKFKKKTEVIQLWHACGAFKRFGFSAINLRDSNTIEFEKKAHINYTKVITSSKEVNKYYSEAFGISEEKIFALGVPKSDLILNSEYINNIKKFLLKEYSILKGKKIVTYAPTFRGDINKRKKFDLKLNFEKILESIGCEYIIILKLHPSVDISNLEIPKKYSNNILDLSIYKEINDILIITDILITDYSSVIFDYSLLERPMIFFSYDLETYLDERNFYYDYKKLVPGPIAYTTDDVVYYILYHQFDLDYVRNFKKKFFDDFDGKATKRIIDTIINEKNL
ncbi:CDP-glycerol glycerophosphotransferase family protein [Clostridioides difficile]|nr:CDP-glycerol glycerophosphotransferase family protein [Clostridioides difficile]